MRKFILTVSILFLPVICFSQSGWYVQNSSTTSTLNDIFFINQQTGWAVGDSGKVVKTTNGGFSWNSQNSGTNIHLNKVQFLNSNTGWITGGMQRMTSPCFYYAIILKTTDGGANWITQYVNDFANVLNDLSIGGQNNVFTTGESFDWSCEVYQNQIYSTTNSGNNWTPLPLGGRSINFINSLTGFAAAEAHNDFQYMLLTRIYKTTNAGTNWFYVSTTDSTINAYLHNTFIRFFDENTGYYISGHFSRTTNGGVNWSKLDSSSVYGMKKFSFLSPNTGYLVGQNKLVKTFTGGTNWVTNSGSTFTGLNSVCAVDTNHVWVCGAGGKIIYGGKELVADTIYAKFIPLKVGNSWTYIQPDPIIPPGIFVRRNSVLKDSIINGHKYFYTNAFEGLNWIRYDSLTTNLLKYSPGNGCSSYPDDQIIDSLAASIGNNIPNCGSFSIRRCSDTASFNLFNQTITSKAFFHDGLTTNSVRYGKNFGVLQTVSPSIPPFSSYLNLKGCVLDGVVYGDTSIFSLYTPYFPLAIGNTWTYKKITTFPPSVTYNKIRIVSDTLIGVNRYYKFSQPLSLTSTNIIRLDTLTGNIYSYSPGSSCGRYANHILVDSLAAKIGDIIHACGSPLNGVGVDTSTISIFSQLIKTKRYMNSGAVDEYRRYGEKFGMVQLSSQEAGPEESFDLQGCIINGVVYGDTNTTEVSPYKPYLPLKVGNSWTYRYTIFPSIDTIYTTTITSETTISGIKYYTFSAGFPSAYGVNMIALDTNTGNIYGYNQSSSCLRYPNRVLLDSLAAKKSDTIKACPTTLNGICSDTSTTTKFGFSVRTKTFVNTYPMTLYPHRIYSEKFGIISASTNEVDFISYTLLSCTINGITYGDTLKTISGTVKFSDNNLPASGGYVKALKLNTSNGNIITVDSVQIGVNGDYILNNVPNDLYYIVAYPNSEKQADFIPTYYPSTINWQNAVKVNSANNPSNVNISVYRKSMMGGAYSVNGWITTQSNNLPAGIKDAIIYMKQGNVFRDYFITQNSGQYNLNSLTSGSYEVVVDRLGYVSAQQNVIITNGNLENINFALVRVGIQNITDVIPENFNLYQNYPNPFNPVTNIKFDIPKSSMVSLKVYDVIGKEAAVLLNGVKQAGSYLVDFDASALSSGIYFYRIETETFTETKRMIILK